MRNHQRNSTFFPLGLSDNEEWGKINGKYFITSRLLGVAITLPTFIPVMVLVLLQLFGKRLIPQHKLNIRALWDLFICLILNTITRSVHYTFVFVVIDVKVIWLISISMYWKLFQKKWKLIIDREHGNDPYYSVWIMDYFLWVSFLL